MANPQDPSSFPPQRTMREVRLRLPEDMIGNLSIGDLDERIIADFLTYKRNMKEELSEKIANRERKRMQEHREPDGSDLASFLYDRLDDIEEVLDEEEYNQLESMIMECK